MDEVTFKVGDIVLYTREPSHERGIAEYHNVLLEIVLIRNDLNYPLECQVLPIYREVVKSRVEASRKGAMTMYRMGIHPDEVEAVSYEQIKVGDIVQLITVKGTGGTSAALSQLVGTLLVVTKVESGCVYPVICLPHPLYKNLFDKAGMVWDIPFKPEELEIVSCE